METISLVQEAMKTSNGFQNEFAKVWMVVERGILGPPGIPNTIQDIRVLSRIISCREDSVWWEPYARHAELVVGLLGASLAGRSATPLAKAAVESLQDSKEFLSAEDATAYRFVALRPVPICKWLPDPYHKVYNNRQLDV